MLFGEKNKKSNHQSFVFHEIINIFMKKTKAVEWRRKKKKTYPQGKSYKIYKKSWRFGFLQYLVCIITMYIVYIEEKKEIEFKDKK